MNDEERKEGALWFIERFVQGGTGRNFAKRNLGLEPGAASIQARTRRKHKQYDFDMVGLGGKILIVPRTQDAKWALGVIYKNQDEWRYLALTEDNFWKEFEQADAAEVR